jgi:uncharacterized membrane protein
LRWLHLLGARKLIGAGAGIAFFMMMAHRSGDGRLIAWVGRIVMMPILGSPPPPWWRNR